MYKLFRRFRTFQNLSCNTYFKKGCFSDACFIARSASCLLNLGLLFSSYHRTCSPKTRASVYFYDLVSPGVHLARKATNAFIYIKHDALRSMKQHGSCITEATLCEIGVYKLRCILGLS